MLSDLRHVMSETHAVTVAKYLNLECQRAVARKLGIQQPAVSKRLREAGAEVLAATGQYVDFAKLVREKRQQRNAARAALHLN